MSDTHTASSGGRFEVRTTSDSHFGWLRTRLSVERTMMSWQRTSVALIGFGFAIVQYFNRLQQIPGAQPAYLPTIGTERLSKGGARNTKRGERICPSTERKWESLKIIHSPN